MERGADAPARVLSEAQSLARLAELLGKARSAVALTGAGVSVPPTSALRARGCGSG
jgi:hypothetical protein